MPPAPRSRDDAGPQQHGEIGRQPAHQHRQDRDREARDHDAHLADHVADRTEHRLHQRERQREGGGQQRDRVRIDTDVMRDRRDDRIGRARGERRDEADQAQSQRSGCALAVIGLFGEFRLRASGEPAKSCRRATGRNRILAGNSLAVESHTRFPAVLLCSAGMPHPTIAWGRNREVFLVIGPSPRVPRGRRACRPRSRSRSPHNSPQIAAGSRPPGARNLPRRRGPRPGRPPARRPRSSTFAPSRE